MKFFLHGYAMAIFSPRKYEQVLRFLLVGCTNFLVSFTVFTFCYTQLKLGNYFLKIPNGAISTITGYAAGILNSFIWNKIWTFRARYDTGKQFFNFIILNIFCLLLSSGIVSMFVDFLGASHKPVWLFTMSGITIINYFACKNWVFSKNKYSL